MLSPVQLMACNTVVEMLCKSRDFVIQLQGLLICPSLAYRAGVTSAITAPSHGRFFAGLGTFFSLGATHKLEQGASIQEVTGVHVSVRHFGKTPSISTQILALRRMLLGPSRGASGHWFKEVTEVCKTSTHCDVILNSLDYFRAGYRLSWRPIAQI